MSRMFFRVASGRAARSSYGVCRPPLPVSWMIRSPAESQSISSGSDRKSTRLNSSHANISYAVFCLKKKKQTHDRQQKSNEISKHELTNKSYRTHRDKSCDNSHGLII